MLVVVLTEGGGEATARQATRRLSDVKIVRHIVTQRKSRTSNHEANGDKTPQKQKTRNRCAYYLPAVGWSIEEQRKGSGYFSTATVPSSSSGIRCGSITLSWTPTEMALFSHIVLLQQRQGNRRHSGSSRSKAIPRRRKRLEPQCPLSKSQFRSLRDYWMRHPPRS